jgi:hypothetical protein
LKPYSSISFLRSSSEFFRAFLFRQNHNPNRTSKATATTGTTTATATFPPPDKPPELLEGFEVLDAKAAVEDEELDAFEDVDEVSAGVDGEVFAAVDVMKMVVGSMLPLLAADSVTTEEIMTTDRVS